MRRYVLLVLSIVSIAFILSSCMDLNRTISASSNLSYVFRQTGSQTSSATWTNSWKYLTNNWVVSSPMVSNGIVYIGSVDHYLYALNSQTGAKEWAVELAGPVISSPSMYSGNIYVTAASLSSLTVDATGQGYLYKISTSGAKTVLYTFPNIVGTSPVIGSDGTVYVGCLDDRMYAVSGNGSLEWSYLTGGRIGSSPSLSSDGSTVYFGSEDGYLYALNASNGTLDWKYQTGGAIISSPAIDSNGTVYFGSLDGYVYAVKKDGTLAWKYSLGSRIGSSPSISGNILYIGDENGYLYAINTATGQKVWSYKTGGYIMSSPAVDANGTVYVGSADGYLYAVSSTGALQWKYPTGDVVGSSPAIGSDGKIYFGSNTGYVYAIVGNGVGIGSGPWAMFRKDASHSAVAPSGSGEKLLGDFNDNGQLDFDDLMNLAMAWGAQTGDSRYNVLYDIGPAAQNSNGVYVTAYPDGKINFQDLMVFAMNWGRTLASSVGISSVDSVDVSGLNVTRSDDGNTVIFTVNAAGKTGFDIVIAENGARFIGKSGLDSDIVLVREGNGLFEVMAAGTGKALDGTLTLKFKKGSGNPEMIKEVSR